MGFPRDMRLWQTHLFLMFLEPLSWKHGGHSVESWRINLIKMTGPDSHHCPSCIWWNYQDVNSITNLWWTSEFPVIQVKMVLSSVVYMLKQWYYVCMDSTIYQASDSFLLSVVCGTSCHEECCVQNFSSISHHGPERMLHLSTP